MSKHVMGPDCAYCDDNGCSKCNPQRFTCCAALLDDPMQWCQLHAAAPALLEALELILAGYDVLTLKIAGIDAVESDEFARRARAAIAQAKGE